jgi:PEP-CTERM motif
MKSLVAGLAAVCAAAAFAAPAEAAYVVNIEQVGSSVIATGSGSLDLTALTKSAVQSPDDFIFPGGGTLALGDETAKVGKLQGYRGISGPASFGSGGGTPGLGGGTGSDLWVQAESNHLYVSLDYVSGTPLGTSTAIFTDSTFASLGVTPGTYVWTWGTGADADSLTMNIGGVPEPATWAMLILGVAMVGLTARRRRKAAPLAA